MNRLLFLLLITFLASAHDQAVHNYKSLQYHITPSSVLEINGTTNIHSFCCISEEKFEKKILRYQTDDTALQIFFDQTILPISIYQLDCGGKAINKDLCKTLHADEYPNIEIELTEASSQDCVSIENCDRWASFITTTYITIACATKKVHIPVELTKLDDQMYRIKGGVVINLRQFGIEPPSTLLGMIKVKEQLDIYFDLHVALQQRGD